VGWADRAAQELGAQRVLTVRAANSTMLLAAVRKVDPHGDFAMAVARTDGASAENRLLAVDSSRLAAVAIAPEGFGVSDVDSVARLLRRPAMPSPSIGDGPITVDLKGPPGLSADRPVALRLHVMTAGGGLTTMDFGPLTSYRNTYQANVTTCPGAGCRLVAVEPVMPIQDATAVRDATPVQTTMELYGITQSSRDVAPPSMLADITRWSGQVGAVGVGNVLSARDGHLSITPFTGALPQGQRRDYRVFVVDAPVPLPLVLAGARPVAQRPGDERFTIMGTERVAYQVVATTSLLPRLGTSGGLVDLEYAQRSGSRGAEAAVLEVWLNAAAPPDAVARLRTADVHVLTDESVHDVANRLAEQGPGEALTFQLFAGGIVLLLAAGTMMITSTVERRARVEELTALRAQGLSEASMVVAGYGGTGVLVVAAMLTGLVAALLAQAVVATSMPIFTDRWSLLPLHQGPQPMPMMVAVVAAVLILGTAAVAGSAGVVASVRGRPARRRALRAPAAERGGEAS
jgi:putative ABC transport system permease protein